MKKSIFLFKISILFLVALFFNSLNLFAENKEAKEVNKPEFKKLLDGLKLNGSILIYDFKNNTFYSNDFKWAKTAHLPASTFKIPNSIIALETGVVENDSSVSKWDGKERYFKLWEQDLKFKDAFKYSCVPCYQEIARKIGFSRMKSYLKKLDYKGMVFNEKNIDNFWLEGKSKISQFEQIDFLKRFFFLELPISKRTTILMKNIMIAEKTDKYVLSGKTGWGMRQGNNNGWYIGYVEVNNEVFFFATNVEPKKDFNLDNFNSVRLEVTKEALKLMKIIE